MDVPHTNRRYTSYERQHLLANLDIEVAHRSRQFESWLSDRLENFNMHQEGQILRIPKQVRNMTMREFGEKYNGNIQAALRGFQKDKFATANSIGTLGELDKDARKRKWVASQESGDDDKDKDKALKNARLAAFTPQKKIPGSSTGPGTVQRTQLPATRNKTPSILRTMTRIPPSPSPQKDRPPFGSNLGTSIQHSQVPSRPTSPVKPSSSRQPVSRVPSSSTFNPELPPKTPKYPSKVQAPSMPTTLRLPRRDESMLSVNGSPLANPYQFDIGWFGGMDMADADTDAEDGQNGSDSQAEQQILKRAKSSIIIRRDPSVTLASYMNGKRGLHSRTNSKQSNHIDPSQSTPSIHFYEDSQPRPQSQSRPSIDSQSTYSTHMPSPHSQPSGNASHLNPTTPRPLQIHTRSFSALVAIPTKDGHLLEFDPLQTSPRALDALDGISESAKKQARTEMGRLVQAAVDKWKLG